MNFAAAAIAVAMNAPGFFESPHPLRRTTCYGGAVIEDKTGKLLWGRDPNTPRYPASTTKILTTLLLLEKCDPEDVVVAPPEIQKIGEASMHLQPGEGVKVKNMAYALMLRSANDGCYAVAKHISGSATAFADLMNARAAQIGCKNTKFVTPNGLHSPNHATTPLDLCLIAREAMRREDFREIARTKVKVIERSKNFGDRRMQSKNKILWSDPTADGIKTGFTNPAGHTYVGSASRNGMRIIDSLMYAPKWKDDHKEMMDWAFSEYEVKVVMAKGAVASEMLKAVGVQCGAELRKAAYACVHRSGDLVETSFEVATGSRPFKAGDQIGSLVIIDKDKFVQKLPLYATSDEPLSVSIGGSKMNLVANPVGIGIGGLALVGLGLGAAFLRSKKLAQSEPTSY
jgi:D-alanyl-D-alanine carboxypeptidase (penicillin-binding protein 5/6)